MWGWGDNEGSLSLWHDDVAGIFKLFKFFFFKIEIFIPLIFESVNEKRNKLLLGISMNVSQGNLIEIKIYSNENSTN